MKQKHGINKKFFFCLIVTNLCSVTLGAYGLKDEANAKKSLVTNSEETIIRIPVKLFTRAPKENEKYKEVTVKTKQGQIIFEKAKLLAVLEQKNLEHSFAEIIVKKNQLNRNLNQEYFQVTPYQNVIRNYLTKAPGEIHEIKF